jgi:hypothetical protein
MASFNQVLVENLREFTARFDCTFVRAILDVTQAVP